MDPFRVLGQVGLGSDSPQPSPWRERRAAVMLYTVARWRLAFSGRLASLSGGSFSARYPSPWTLHRFLLLA